MQIWCWFKLFKMVCELQIMLNIEYAATTQLHHLFVFRIILCYEHYFDLLFDCDEVSTRRKYPNIPDILSGYEKCAWHKNTKSMRRTRQALCQALSLLCLVLFFLFNIFKIGLPRGEREIFYACCLKSGVDPVFVIVCIYINVSLVCSFNTFQWGALAFAVRTCNFSMGPPLFLPIAFSFSPFLCGFCNHVHVFCLFAKKDKMICRRW